MASFQAKICWGRPRKAEKKNGSDEFLSDLQKKIPKNSKKIQKIKKHHCGFFPSQNMMGKAEKERK